MPLASERAKGASASTRVSLAIVVALVFVVVVLAGAVLASSTLSIIGVGKSPSTTTAFVAGGVVAAAIVAPHAMANAQNSTRAVTPKTPRRRVMA
jgi:hypothetical protein